MNYREIVPIEPGKRGGRPCIRGMRIPVYDVLGWLAAGMTNEQIIEEFPELSQNPALHHIEINLTNPGSRNFKSMAQETRDVQCSRGSGFGLTISSASRSR